jgi:hypothetical protein
VFAQIYLFCAYYQYGAILNCLLIGVCGSSKLYFQNLEFVGLMFWYTECMSVDGKLDVGCLNGGLGVFFGGYSLGDGLF